MCTPVLPLQKLSQDTCPSTDTIPSVKESLTSLGATFPYSCHLLCYPPGTCRLALLSGEPHSFCLWCFFLDYQMSFSLFLESWFKCGLLTKLLLNYSRIAAHPLPCFTFTRSIYHLLQITSCSPFCCLAIPLP